MFLGRPLIDSLLFGAALAVGLFPQLLLAVVTVTLALAAGKLAEAGVLVKRSVAIENLGAMEVLCTHKTGTLTDGKVHLDRALDFSGNSLEATIMWAGLNAKLQTGLYGAPSDLLRADSANFNLCCRAGTPARSDVTVLQEKYPRPKAGL